MSVVVVIVSVIVVVVRVSGVGVLERKDSENVYSESRYDDPHERIVHHQLGVVCRVSVPQTLTRLLDNLQCRHGEKQTIQQRGEWLDATVPEWHEHRLTHVAARARLRYERGNDQTKNHAAIVEQHMQCVALHSQRI